jgi:putative heme-binding domain-containing protein
MRTSVHVTRCSALVIAGMLSMSLQGQPAPQAKDDLKNPFTSDEKAIKQGALLFRQECVYCHGLGARGGGRGPDLTTGMWSHGGSDADLRRTISEGVPGTAMAANHLTDDEMWEIIAYLRTLQSPPSPQGDAKRGESIFFGSGNCVACHMVAGRGGRLGPELTRIGSARSRAYLMESIREPDRELTHNRNVPEWLNLDYDTVIATTRDGKTVTGVVMNEDTFTVQIMDASEKIYSFQKKSLKSFRHERRSQMPAYPRERLSDQDLQDLVAFLQTLRPSSTATDEGGSHDHK